MPSSCLPFAALEDAAAHGPGVLTAEDREHLESCDECRAWFADVRANNRFLSRFDAPAPDAADASRPPEAALEPDAIPGYSIRRVIGRGGQGIVYEAVQTSTLRRVALKVMLFDSPSSVRRQQRFEREILLASELRHPGIVTLYDSGVTSGGRLYFAMELVEGVPIDRFVGAGGPGPGPAEPERELLGIPETLRLFAKVCEAVRHAHQRGIIHRDLKPGNILVDRDGEPHVLDFGLAKRVDAPLGRGLTLTGAWQGTIAYAAPEQVATDKRVEDTRTDVHALGLVLYEILTGSHPFAIGGALSEIIRDVTETQPAPPSTLRPRIGDEIDTIVLKALAKEPERRYESAAALLEDIRRYEERRPIAARRDSTLYLLRKIAGRHRRTVAVSVAILIAAIGLAGWIVSAERRATESFHKAAESADALAVRLAESEIERGRAAGPPLGERLVWRHHLLLAEPRAEDARRPLALATPPGPALSYWALSEQYAKHPCLATAAVAAAVHQVRFLEGSGVVRSLQEDGSIADWSPDARTLVARRPPEPPPFEWTRLSGDGRRLSIARGMRIATVEVDSGALVGEIEAGAKTLWIAPDWKGERLAVATVDRGVFVSGAAGESRCVLRLPSPDVDAVAAIEISPDGRFVSMRLEGGEIAMHDVESAGSPAVLVERPRAGLRGRPAFSRETGLAIAAFRAGDPTASAWESLGAWRLGPSGAWELAATIASPMPWFGTLDTRGADLAACQWDRVAIFDLAAVKPTDTRVAFGGHEREVRSVAISPDGTLVVSGDKGGVLKLWERSPDRNVTEWPESDLRSYHATATSADGRLLAATGKMGGSAGEPERGFVQILCVGGEPSRPAPDAWAGGSIVSAVTFAPDGSALATASHDGSIRLHRLGADGSLVLAAETALAPGAPVNALAFAPDGATVAVASDAGVHEWTPLAPGGGAGTLAPRAGHRQRVPAVDYAPDGSLFATGSMDRTVRLFHPGSAAEGVVLGEHAAGIRVVRFSPDGSLLATAGDDARVKIWDVRSRRAIATLDGHEAQVFALAFTPDGSMLASGDSAGSIRLWEVRSGRPLVVFRRARAMFASLEFSREDGGRTLIAASLTGGLIRYDLRYYERHMAGNLSDALDRLAAEAGETPLDPEGVALWRAWADETLAGAASSPEKKPVGAVRTGPGPR